MGTIIEPKLPSNNEDNWGQSLNSYLKWLGKRVSNLELKNTIADTTGVLGNSGGNYMGTGWQSCEKFSYSDSSKTITVKGSIYIGGSTFRSVNINKTHTLEGTGYNYVYLHYDKDSTSDPWKFELLKTFKYSLVYILLGFCYDTSFQPYFQTCGATLSEHKYNIDHIWGNFDGIDTTVTVDEGQNLIVSLSGNGTFNGAYLTDVSSSLVNDSQYFGSVVQIAHYFSSSSGGFYKQKKDTDGTLLKEYESDTPSIASDSDYIARICIDIFGNVLVFKSSALTISFSDDRVYQELYTAPFLSLNDESLCFAPGCLLELCRFGVKRNTSNKTTTLNSGGENNCSDTIFITKSLNHGVLCQQSLNAWSTNSGTVNLNQIKFRSGESGSSAQFDIKTLNWKEGDHFIVNRELFSNSNDEGLLVTIPFLTDRIAKTETVMSLATDILFIPLDNFIIEVLDIQYLTGTETKTYTGNYTIVNNKPVLGSDSTYNYYIELELKEEYGDKQFTVTYIANNGAYNFTIVDPQPLNVTLPSNVTNTISGDVTNTIDGKVTYKADLGFDISSERSGRYGMIYSEIQASAYEGISLKTHKQSDERPTPISSITMNTGAISIEQGSTSITIEEGTITMATQEDSSAEPQPIPQLQLTRDATTDTPLAIFDANIQLKSGRIIEYLSDRRLKENIVPLKLSYSDAILNTPIVHYNYLHDDKPQVGIVAQDLEATLPANQDVFIKVGKGDGLDDRRTIAETKLVYILWKGLQEEIEARKKLEQEIGELKKGR